MLQFEIFEKNVIFNGLLSFPPFFLQLGDKKCYTFFLLMFLLEKRQGVVQYM